MTDIKFKPKTGVSNCKQCLNLKSLIRKILCKYPFEKCPRGIKQPIKKKEATNEQHQPL